jgi:hypothetical protein
MPTKSGYCGPVAAPSNDTAASAHGLDCPVVSRSQFNERGFVMKHMMNYTGGGMVIWTVIGVLVVVLLVVAIIKLSNKKIVHSRPVREVNC